MITHVQCVLGLQIRNLIKMFASEIMHGKTVDRYWKSEKNCLVLKLNIQLEIAIEKKLAISKLNVKSLS